MAPRGATAQLARTDRMEAEDAAHASATEDEDEITPVVPDSSNPRIAFRIKKFHAMRFLSRTLPRPTILALPDEQVKQLIVAASPDWGEEMIPVENIPWLGNVQRLLAENVGRRSRRFRVARRAGAASVNPMPYAEPIAVNPALGATGDVPITELQAYGLMGDGSTPSSTPRANSSISLDRRLHRTSRLPPTRAPRPTPSRRPPMYGTTKKSPTKKAKNGRTIRELEQMLRSARANEASADSEGGSSAVSCAASQMRVQNTRVTNRSSQIVTNRNPPSPLLSRAFFGEGQQSVSVNQSRYGGGFRNTDVASWIFNGGPRVVNRGPYQFNSVSTGIHSEISPFNDCGSRYIEHEADHLRNFQAGVHGGFTHLNTSSPDIDSRIMNFGKRSQGEETVSSLMNGSQSTPAGTSLINTGAVNFDGSSQRNEPLTHMNDVHFNMAEQAVHASSYTQRVETGSRNISSASMPSYCGSASASKKSLLLDAISADEILGLRRNPNDGGQNAEMLSSHARNVDNNSMIATAAAQHIESETSRFGNGSVRIDSGTSASDLLEVGDQNSGDTNTEGNGTSPGNDDIVAMSLSGQQGEVGESHADVMEYNDSEYVLRDVKDSNNDVAEVYTNDSVPRFGNVEDYNHDTHGLHLDFVDMIVEETEAGYNNSDSRNLKEELVLTEGDLLAEEGGLHVAESGYAIVQQPEQVAERETDTMQRGSNITGDDPTSIEVEPFASQGEPLVSSETHYTNDDVVSTIQGDTLVTHTSAPTLTGDSPSVAVDDTVVAHEAFLFDGEFLFPEE